MVFRRKHRTTEPPLLPLTPWDDLTLAQLFEGVLAMGATGSGKSSTLLHLMLALMRLNVGMLFLTSKRDDYETIARMAKLAKRESALVRFSTDGPWRFDFLNYELSAGGNLITAGQLMQDLVDISTRTSSQNSSEPFWLIAACRKIRMAMTLVYRATGQCSVEDLYRCSTSMPNTQDQRDSPEFKETDCYLALNAAVHKYPDDYDVGLAVDYVLHEWPRMSDRTAGSIDAHVINVLEKLMSGSVRDLIASGVTNCSPAMLDDGNLIVINTPILTHREPGQLVQAAWKLSTQRHALRRESKRPIVIWADEAQCHAIPSVDSMIQAVARSHRLINIAITQNIPLLESVLKRREDVLAWISNLQTKFIFANSDKDTNEYFSSMFGQSKQLMGGTSTRPGQVDPLQDWFGGQRQDANYSLNENWLPDVRPEEFSRLRKGGHENDCVVDFYCFQGGRRFSNGKTWIKTSFMQMTE